MFFAHRRPVYLGLGFLLATAALFGSCSDQTAPREPVTGRFGLAPRFEASAAGIVPLARGRFVLTRVDDGTIAKDTVIDIALGQDSVDLSLSVQVYSPDDVFQLRITLITPDGDTAFRAGPVEVTPASSGVPPIIPITLVYVGVGFDAAFVSISGPIAALVAGDTVTLVAVAYDSGETPIPGTPIGWRSLDPLIAAVPDQATGRVVGLARGTARIVAELLTGPADTVGLPVTLPPASIAADSGSGQAGPAGGALPNRLVARVLASDGIGVSGQWVRFAVTLGSGTVSADSVLTDSAGRAGVTWTLGNLVGSQSVTATTPALTAASAVFTATSQATGPGTITIVAGNNQTGLVETAVATAPSVRVADTQDNPVPGVEVVFAVTQGGGALTGATDTTDAAGLAAVGSWTLGPAAGLNALTATVTGLTPAQFLALGTGAGGVTQMTLSAGNGQTVLAQTAVPIAPAVLVRDTSGTPISGVTVTFAVTQGGGSVTGGSAVSNASGIATVGSWTLGAPGLNTLTASLTGLPDVEFQATGTVGPADTVIVVSGNAQTETAGTALPLPLVVEVRDSAGNPVADAAVTWATLDGSITPTTSATDAAGRAQATWTLGVNRIAQTATATVSGVTPAVFTATATFVNPTILLALGGTDRIRLSDSALLTVTLTAPAGVDGAVINFSVDNRAIVGLDTTDLFIPEAGTTAQQWLYGLSSGSTTVRATASGYADGAVSVLVTVQVLSMPTALNVPFGGTASLPLQISTPAPAGGVTVTLVSDNPAAVGVLTPTVTIAQGQQTASAIVSGVAPGTATITGSTVDFGIDQTAAATRANLNIIDGSSTFPSTFVDTLTVRLESSGSPVAAPGAGVSVTFTPRNLDCVAATSPVTIPAGLVSATFIASYAGVATTPCNTYLVATATGIDPDSVNVTVNPPPSITAPAYTVGSGLQLGSNGYGYLGASNHGGVNVVVKTTDPTRLLIAPNQATVGGDSLVIPVANGQIYFYYNLQALEGVTDTTGVQVQVSYSAPGFNPTTQMHTVRPAAFDLYPIPANTTTLSDSTAFYAYIGYSLPGYPYLNEQQPIRAGGQPLTVTLVNDTLGVGNLVTTAGAGDTATVIIPVGASNSPTSVAAGGVAYNPDNPGVTTITGGIPGLLQRRYYNRQITVSAPNITAPTYTLGSGLQLSSNGYGQLGASNHGGVNVVVKTTDPTRLLIAPNQATVGGDSLVIPVANGQIYFYYNLQALEGVTDTTGVQVQVSYSAPGFNPTTQMHTVRPAAFDLYPIPANTTTLSDSTAFYAYIGYSLPNYPYLNDQQPIRPGGQPLTVTLVNDTLGVGNLVTTAGAGDTVTVTIPVGASNSPTSVGAGGVAYNPDNPGVTTITGGIPGLFQRQYYNRQITVSAPNITAPAYTVGSGLQLSSNGYGYLGASNHGGVNVVVKTTDPTRLLIAPNQATVGGDSLVIPVANGQIYFYYNLQALEGVTDTTGVQVQVSYSAPGFNPTTQMHTVRPPAFDLYPIPANTTTLSDSSAFYAYIGYSLPGYPYLNEQQPIRAGGQAATVTIMNGTPGVGQLITQAGGADTVTVGIPVGASNSPTTVAAGGVAFDPLTAGTTTITGSIPGFIERRYYNRTVTVSAPSITLYEHTVGSGLQRGTGSTYGYLSASNHGGVDVWVRSSAPGVARLAPDDATPGTDSVSIFVPDGQQYFYYNVQGVEGQTGTVTTTARASGFTDGTIPLNVVTPAVRIANLGTSYSLAQAPDSILFYAEAGIPYSDNQYLLELQSVRAGGTALTVTLSSSQPAVADLVTASIPGGSSVTVPIPVGAFRSPTTVANGGVALKKKSQGTTVVTSAIAGFITTTVQGVVTVNITP